MKKPFYHDAILATCQHKHLSVDEIFFSLKKEHPQIGIATVYRNIKTLTEQWKLIKVPVWNSWDRYEVACEDHAHIINAHGEIHDVTIPEDLLKQLHSLVEGKIEKLELNFYVS